MTSAEREFYHSSTMATFTGKRVNPLDLKPEDIDIRDIAHGLANICRFNGQCSRFYSVAEHSVLVSKIAEQRLVNGSPFLPHIDSDNFLIVAKYGLLHDAAEAYLGDVIRPIKKGEKWQEIKNIQDRAQAAIQKRFGVSDIGHSWVKLVDMDLVLTEGSQLFPKDKTVILFPAERIKGDTPIGVFSPEQAEAAFLQRFTDLWV